MPITAHRLGVNAAFFFDSLRCGGVANAAIAEPAVRTNESASWEKIIVVVMFAVEWLMLLLFAEIFLLCCAVVVSFPFFGTQNLCCVVSGCKRYKLPTRTPQQRYQILTDLMWMFFDTFFFGASDMEIFSPALKITFEHKEASAK